MKKFISILSFLALLITHTSVFAGEATGTINTGTQTGVEGVAITEPTVSPSAGSVASGTSISISASGAPYICYTINGTDPSCNWASLGCTSGTKYSSAFSITSATTVKALSCYQGAQSSAVSSFSYTIQSSGGGGGGAPTTTSSIPTTTTATTINGKTNDIAPTSAKEGEATLDAGKTAITLSDTTSLDLSKAVKSVAEKVLTVGERVVTIEKSVTLESGIDGRDIVIKNDLLKNVALTLSDATMILSSKEWTGTIQPPTKVTSTGIAPSGFSVGSTSIEVGSKDAVLVLDKPATLILAGVTGDVGYKPAGEEQWYKIENKCDGTFADPKAPIFPGECYISNGRDTKIHTFHFTSFAALKKANAQGSNPTEIEMFSDMTGHWAKKYVDALAKEGVVKGRSAGKYEPEGIISRAEFVTIIGRAFKLEAKSAATTPFVDVPDNAWFAPYVQAAYEAGYIKGNEMNGKLYFRPADPVTRSEAMKVILMAEKVTASGTDDNFDDVKSTDWFAPYVSYAAQKGIVKGVAPRKFDPAGGLNRGQIAKIIVLVREVK